MDMRKIYKSAFKKAIDKGNYKICYYCINKLEKTQTK